MAALPPPPNNRSAADTAAAESAFEATAWDELIARTARAPRWVGARLRVLLVLCVLAALALAALVQQLAISPHWHAQWRADPTGRLELVASIDPQLADLAGQPLRGVQLPDGSLAPLDATLLWRSPRWIVDDAERENHAQQHARLRDALDSGRLALLFAPADRAEPALAPRGLLGLGAMFWVMAALALVLVLMAAAMLLLRPTLRSALYAAMAFAQAGNLLFIAVTSPTGLALPAWLLAWDLPARGAFDLVTAAAIVHATGIHPRPVRHRHVIAALGWSAAIVLVVLLAAGALPQPWWWLQGAALGLGAVAIWQLGAQAGEPHPLAVLLRRFGIVAVGTLALLTLALAAGAGAPAPNAVAAAGTVVWVVFLASLLLALPFLSRSQALVREFALLAGVTTAATSLDLLFVAVFALGAFTSLTLTVFISLGLYVGIRQWILSQLAGSNMLTTERMFEQLYRSAREVQARPERAADSVSRLLRELFQPAEVLQVERETDRARVFGSGSTLLVPLPRLAGAPEGVGGTVVLRYAHRGQRLFTPEDARLSDRVLEQLKRAVDYDRAVELGRSEERVRIAQDLHDDIGARLLTLMYQAPTPEVEEYVRHTLQDLKTLTRGLATPTHRLSHAAAEWKTDITQRLAAGQCELAWSFSTDRDIVLSVVQWSALTRVLRELVSNILVHARASRVEIDALYYGGRLTLTVSDNGCGRDPQGWAHGLGLGGVRKRVKQLGGSVEWRENPSAGVRCEVVLPVLKEKR
jgi:signal transduction histidine kinase